MDFVYSILIAIVALALGAAITMAIQRYLARGKAAAIIEEAKAQAEVIKKDKLLEAREEELRIKTEAENAANQRMSRVQSAEGRIKQRELQLNQQQSENQRAKNENEAIRARLEDQIAKNEVKQNELEALKRHAQEELERVSGLSSEEAKEKLIESLKDEAKTAAASYINDIMDEAKMTANKEAKRIVVQSIQRVAT